MNRKIPWKPINSKTNKNEPDAMYFMFVVDPLRVKRLHVPLQDDLK